MTIRLTGTLPELQLGLVRLRQAFYELTEISDPYPSDEVPGALCVDIEAQF